MNEAFRKFSNKASEAVGSPWAFIAAAAIVIAWAISGPFFGFSEVWQLVINTGTTIITFLMVFLIQNTQNRDSKALHLKLDELIRTKKGARYSMVDLEDMSDDELKTLKAQFVQLQNGQMGGQTDDDDKASEEEESEAQQPQPVGAGSR